jgi:hypothetical protein
VAALARLRQLADAVIGLDSFAGTPYAEDAALKEYDGAVFRLSPEPIGLAMAAHPLWLAGPGFVRVEALPRLNTLLHTVPETFDLAFKMKRKGFLIEVGALWEPCASLLARPTQCWVGGVF